MTIPCECEFCKAAHLVKCFEVTEEAIREQRKAAKLVWRNQIQGLKRLDLFEKAEFIRDHPEYTMCIRCDEVEKVVCCVKIGEAFICVACDNSDHA